MLNIHGQYPVFQSVYSDFEQKKSDSAKIWVDRVSGNTAFFGLIAHFFKFGSQTITGLSSFRHLLDVLLENPNAFSSKTFHKEAACKKEYSLTGMKRNTLSSHIGCKYT